MEKTKQYGQKRLIKGRKVDKEKEKKRKWEAKKNIYVSFTTGDGKASKEIIKPLKKKLFHNTTSEKKKLFMVECIGLPP